ncbi:MAG: response regulator transcription factor [Faecousia sp.]
MQTIQDAKILIVDDSRELRDLLTEELNSAGYHHLKSADSVKTARQAIGEEMPELVILDINLPDGDGFSLFREIRAHSDVPILFLSARDADSDRLFGLGLGADDYMTKPFLMQELLLRVSGILRRFYRGQLRRETVIRLGQCTVDFGDATVTNPGGTVSLTATERTILQKLLDNRGHIVTYDALCEAVWGGDYYGYENSLNVHIRHLREKVEAQPSQPKWILTARGLGYRLSKEASQ